MNGEQANAMSDAMTKRDYENARKADEERIRDRLGEESERERQKRLWAEENRRRGR